MMGLDSKQRCDSIQECYSSAARAVKLVNEWFVVTKPGVFEMFEVMIRQAARALPGSIYLRRALHKKTAAVEGDVP